MKKILYLLLFLFSTSVLAQDSLTVTRLNKSISKGNQPGFTIDIPLTNAKRVTSAWKKMLKRNKGVDAGKGKETMLRVAIPEVSKDTLWVYALTEQTNDRTTFITFISKDDSIFFNSGEEADNFARYVRNISVDLYREGVREQLNDERENLRKMENQLEELNQQADKWHKDINENNRAADRIRDQIGMDKKDQDLKNDAIYKQKQVLATYQTPSEQKKEEENKLKDLEKEKKKIMNKIESSNEKIDDLENENKQLERRIAKNMDELIPAQRDSIVKQKEKIAGIEVRLNSVR